MNRDSSLPEKLLRPYSAPETEPAILRTWDESGFFNPDVCIEKGVTHQDAEHFSIVLPPPNVTGTLHTGHALMLVIQDIMVRYQRMLGKKHFGFQVLITLPLLRSQRLKNFWKKKVRKNDLGREEFLKRVEQYAQDSHDTIVNQAKRMGASLDWSREAYTLDEKRTFAVRTAFKKMYDDGLIYRGHRIVNWDPKGQTTISDDELVYQEETTKFYYFKYGPFTIGTARPETKFGDKYVVMHPDDARYAQYQHGDKLTVEWINGPLEATIIKDPMIDMEFGTGVMTITPWHSKEDFALAEKYNLDKEQIIDQYGKLLPIAGEFAGMKIKDAREKIVEKLQAKGLVEKIENGYKHNVATAERTGALIEPQIMNQWFIDVNKPIAARNNKSLKQLMQEAVTSKSIQILPERFEKNYFFWIDNLQDWCISRQIWFGHRIPVWYDKTGGTHLPRSRNIIFIRHGESEGNVNKIYTGRTDSPLTEKGRAQAKEAAKKLEGRTIGKIISSDLSRAIETAAIISKELGLPTESYPEFQEVFGGDLEGTKKEDIPLLVAALTAGTGETSTMLLKRARQAWEIIKNDTSDGDIVIVGHGSFSAVMKAFLEGEEDLVAFRKKWHMDNAALFEFPILIDPKGDDLVQDPDTLDTWFSSGLWTFSTLGWPEQTTDLATYHPTSVLETGHDTLFFWIARMILMSTYLLGEVPFKTVYLHGMVRAADGQKMSKSLGNAAVDPLDIISKYGNDALRLAMIIGNTPGNDLKLNENDIRGYAKFCNKIWNASRFVLENIQDLNLSEPIELDAEDQQAADELRTTLETVTKEMNEYKFSLAAEKLYHYFWHTFADVLIERSKKKISEGAGKQSAQWLLYTHLETLLKTLHPFMPFVTEELWSVMPKQGEPVTSDRKLLIIETWPA